MNGRTLTLSTLAGLAVAGFVAKRRGSRDAASEQAADYFLPASSRYQRNLSVQQSGNGVVSHRFPSWTSVRRRLQRDGFTHDFGHLEDAYAEEGLSEREKTKRVWEDLERDWDTFTGYAFDFTDPIRIWRAVTADSIEALRLPRPALPSAAARRRERQLALPFKQFSARHNPSDKEGVGIWWSWDPQAAEAHWGGTHARGFLLAGEVAYDDVNWPATFAANLTSAEEREIQVKPGAPIRLLRVRDDDTGVVEKQNLWVRA